MSESNRGIEMLDWSDYWLKINPFLEGSHIDPYLKDDRLNGKVFSCDGFEKPYNTLLDLIKRERAICYVRSDIRVRGTGKSALMAAVFWLLRLNKELSRTFLPVWATVHDYRTVNQLMGRLLDTFVVSGIMDTIRKKVKTPTSQSIEKLLRNDVDSPNPSSVLALSKILSVSDYELAWRYTNIRRAVPTTSLLEIFTYLLFLFGQESRSRVITFIDQFEEFVEYQRGSMGRLQLANNIKDLYRAAAECDNISFVLSLHPASEPGFVQAGQEIISSYGDVSDNAATVEVLKPSQLVKMAQVYIKHYRVKDAPKKVNASHPFTPDALYLIASRCQRNPRALIRYSHYAITEARINDQRAINRGFLLKPEIAARIRLPTPTRS